MYIRCGEIFVEEKKAILESKAKKSRNKNWDDKKKLEKRPLIIFQKILSRVTFFVYNNLSRILIIHAFWALLFEWQFERHIEWESVTLTDLDFAIHKIFKIPFIYS